MPRTSWHLAKLAGCSEPDNRDGIGFDPPFAPEALEGLTGSAGAQFLRRVESDTLEAISEGRWDEDGDTAHEIADGAVPIYTHEMWKTFTDLGAYNEDPSELDAESDDMTRAAGVCLYMIAERLARAIADEITERLEELRAELRAESISYGELADLQELAPYIAQDDVELREAAGLPEQV